MTQRPFGGGFGGGMGGRGMGGGGFGQGGNVRMQFGPSRVGPIVRGLLIANIAGFVLQALFPWFIDVFGLVPKLVFRGWIWQLATFHFLHGGVGHLLINMLMLWMFGAELEFKFGRNKFIWLVVLSGLGAGLCQVIANGPGGVVPTVGASGIVFGLLLAWGLTWPERQVLVMLIIPMKGKWMAFSAGLIEFLYVLDGRNPGIAHIAHLGGMIFAYVFLRYDTLYMRLRKTYYERKLEHFRKKYRVVDGGKSENKGEGPTKPTYH